MGEGKFRWLGGLSEGDGIGRRRVEGLEGEGGGGMGVEIEGERGVGGVRVV